MPCATGCAAFLGDVDFAAAATLGDCGIFGDDFIEVGVALGKVGSLFGAEVCVAATLGDCGALDDDFIDVGFVFGDTNPSPDDIF